MRGDAARHDLPGRGWRERWRPFQLINIGGSVQHHENTVEPPGCGTALNYRRTFRFTASRQAENSEVLPVAVAVK